MNTPENPTNSGFFEGAEGTYPVDKDDDEVQEILNAPLGAVINFMLARASISTTHFTDPNGNRAIMVLMDDPNRIDMLEAMLEKWAQEDANKAEQNKEAVSDALNRWPRTDQ